MRRSPWISAGISTAANQLAWTLLSFLIVMESAYFSGPLLAPIVTVLQALWFLPLSLAISVATGLAVRVVEAALVTASELVYVAVNSVLVSTLIFVGFVLGSVVYNFGGLIWKPTVVPVAMIFITCAVLGTHIALVQERRSHGA